MKKMLAAALAASMVMGLTACGGSSQPTETKAPENAKETEAAAEGTTEAAAAGDEEKKTGSEMTWKLATDAAKDYPTTKALIKFADEVYEKSNGRIAVDVYESSILGDEVSYMEQLQAGTVDVAKLSIGTLSGLYEDTQVFLLPFLFKNNTEMWKVLEGDVGTTIKNGLNDYSIQGIGFSVATTVATATQALIIPPSHNMIIYGMAAGGLSTGKLFLAGIGPGLMLCAAMCILVARITRKRGYPRGPKYTVRESLKIVSDGFLGVMTIVIILLGVCTGLFTTTESAAIACVYALFVTLFIYKSIKVKDIWRIAKKSLGTLAMILSIIAAANAFCYLMSLMQVPAKITQMLLTVSDNKYVVLILINILLLVLGCFMDVAPLILIVTPILLPVVKALGMDPIHFGIVIMMNLAVGSLTPPVGTTLFAGCAVGDIPIEKATKALLPYYAVMVVALLLVTYIPAFSMTLPNLLMH